MTGDRRSRARTASRPPAARGNGRPARQNRALLELALGGRLFAGDLAQAFRDLTEAAARALDVERSSVWLFSPDRSLIRCADLFEAGLARHSAGLELAAADYPSYFRALESERCIPAHRARTDPRTREFRDGYLVPLGIASMLDAGVRRGGSVVGIVCHEHVGKPRRWSPAEQAFAASIADFATLALEAAERRQVEAALRQSEDRFRTVINSLQDVVFTLDTSLRHVEVFGRWPEKYGVRPEDFIGKTAREVLGDRAAAVHEEAAARALAGEPIVYEWSLATHTDVLHFQTSLSPIHDESGRVAGIVGVGRDITASRAAALHRQALHELSAQLIGPASDREVGRLVARACRKLFGHDAFFIDVFEDGPDRARNLYAEDTAPGGLEPHEVRGADRASPLVRSLYESRAGKLINRRDEPFPPEMNPFGYSFRRSLSLMFAPLRFQNEIVGFMSSQSYTPYRYAEEDLKLLQTVADMCGAALARLRMEEKLRRGEEMLRHAQKMEAVGRLAGGVAHDFNNLFTVIAGYGEILKDKLAPDAPEQAFVSDILAATQKAADLTRQLLAFSRKQVLETRVLDLNALAAGLLPVLRSLAGSAVSVETGFDPALGRVRADPGQMEQVLVNLVLNAREALSPGGRILLRTANAELGPAPLSHGAPRPGRYVQLSVADNGAGMDAETRAHLFEPFFTTKDPGKGAGLGLSTVYGIVSQSGGHVDVTSDAGRGTTVAVYLPRVEEAADAPRAAAPPPSSGGGTILLVEDADVVRKLAREVLRTKGYTVLEARNGAEALRVLAAHAGPVDLLLTDVVMPEMSGPELARRLVASRPGLKCLFMSGYPEEEMDSHGLPEGRRAFLAKPFTLETLASAVRSVLA